MLTLVLLLSTTEPSIPVVLHNDRDVAVNVRLTRRDGAVDVGVVPAHGEVSTAVSAVAREAFAVEVRIGDAIERYATQAGARGPAMCGQVEIWIAATGAQWSDSTARTLPKAKECVPESGGQYPAVRMVEAPLPELCLRVSSFSVKFLDVDHPTPPDLIRLKARQNVRLSNDKATLFDVEPRVHFYEDREWHPIQAVWYLDDKGRLGVDWTTGFQSVMFRTEEKFATGAAPMHAKVIEFGDDRGYNTVGSAMLTVASCP